MFGIFQKIGSILPFFDIFGQRVCLYINSKETATSKLGGFFTILIIFFCFYTFSKNYLSWVNGEQTQIVSSYNSFIIENLNEERPNFMFTLDSSNYYIYFILRRQANSGDLSYNKDLKRYLNYSVTYSDLGYPERDLELEKCSIRKTNTFLLKTNENLKEINEINATSDVRMCMKDGQNVTMGTYYNEFDGLFHIPTLTYRVKRCVNSSENDFFCASSQEIEQVIKETYFQFGLPKSIFDFNKYSNPRKRIYDYKLYDLDSSFKQSFYGSLIPYYLITDEGSLTEDYKQNSVDFNLEQLQYQTLNTEDDDVLFEYSLLFDLNQQTFVRKNQKFYHLFGNLGGTLSLYIFIGKILVGFYNLLILNHNLVNLSFSNLAGEKESKYLIFQYFH